MYRFSIVRKTLIKTEKEVLGQKHTFKTKVIQGQKIVMACWIKSRLNQSKKFFLLKQNQLDEKSRLKMPCYKRGTSLFNHQSINIVI